MPRSQEVSLDFDNLAALDEGRINALLRHHVARIAADCISRPLDKSARKVTLDFIVKPEVDPQTGECDSAFVEIECKSKVPTYRSKTYQMRLSNRGLLFNVDFPDSIDQQPLYKGDAK